MFDIKNRDPYIVYEEEKTIFIQDYIGLAELHNKYNLFIHPEVIEVLNINNDLYNMVINYNSNNSNNTNIEMINNINFLMKKQEILSRMSQSDYYIKLIQANIIKSNLPIEFNDKRIYLVHGGKQYSL